MKLPHLSQTKLKPFCVLYYGGLDKSINCTKNKQKLYDNHPSRFSLPCRQGAIFKFLLLIVVGMKSA